MSLPGLAPTPLKTVIARVQAAFTAASIDAEIRIGEDAIDEEGNANRIVFVYRPQLGRIEAAPIRLGAVGSGRIGYGCTAYVWGESGDSEADRYDAADLLVRDLMVALPDASGDRIEFVTLERDEQTRDDGYGEQFQFSFVYLHQVDRTTRLQAATVTTTATVSIEDPT